MQKEVEFKNYYQNIPNLKLKRLQPIIVFFSNGLLCILKYVISNCDQSNYMQIFYKKKIKYFVKSFFELMAITKNYYV